MGRFSDALNRSAETIKRPPPLPQGSYIFRVTKLPDAPVSMDTRNGKMERLSIPVMAVSVVEVADEQALEEYGVQNVSKTPSRVDFLFMEDDELAFERTMARFKAFCGHCGIDTSEGTMGSWMQELPNAQFTGEVGHRQDPNDDENVFAEIRRTAPVE